MMKSNHIGATLIYKGNLIPSNELSSKFNGSIYLSQCPGKNIFNKKIGKIIYSNLEADILYFSKLNVTTILCLLNDYEMKSIGVNISLYKKLCKEHSINFIQFPIIEMSIPENSYLFYSNIILEILDCLKSSSILIHCRGGIGRSGMVGAILIGIIMNLSAKESIKFIRSKRGKNCVETSRQENFVKEVLNLHNGNET